MGKRYNCECPREHEGKACAGCLAMAYDLLDRAAKIIGDTFSKIEPTWDVIDWHKRYASMVNKSSVR